MKTIKLFFCMILSLSFILTQLMSMPVNAAETKKVIVTASALNVRKGPSTSYAIVRVLKKDQIVTVYETKNGWYRIGTNEWISAKYTKNYTWKVIVTATSLNVRKGPATSYSIVRVLPFNSIVTVYATNNGWFKIATSEWISAKYTKTYTSLSNTKLSWHYIPNSTHSVPKSDTPVDISKYSAYYVGNTSSKNIYLTFDLGYENNYTSKILDSLKSNNVKAAFFVTKTYIDNNPALIKRMVNEGHIVGNHTNTHPSLPDIATQTSTFNNEIQSTAAAFKNLTGNDMPKFIRPPYGEYSELTLYLLKQHGYKSIFWSFAYLDWDIENQPDETSALNKITSNTHNGAIMLLHGVSKTNTNIMDSLLKNIKNQGYQFKTLNEL